MNKDLLDAVDSGNLAEVRQIVADLSTEERVGALFHYCDLCNGNTEQTDAIRLLLDAGCPVNDDSITTHHVTPLHVAAWFGFAEIVDLLLDRGAAIEIRDFEHSSTPLEWALGACRRKQCRPGGDYQRLIKALLAAGAHIDPTSLPVGNADIDAIFKQRLTGSLQEAVLNDDEKLVERLIANGPAQSELDQALCLAARGGKSEICRRLMKAGAIVCIPKGNGWTALNGAVLSGNDATVEALLEGGADVLVRNIRGGTVWHSLAEFGASNQMIDIVIKYGGLPGINTPSYFEFAPLDLAIIEQHTDTIAYLRSHGAKALKEKPEL